ncbi:helix-turn-helix transcriptional regulator [Virgisporangium ochraceum]
MPRRRDVPVTANTKLRDARLRFPSPQRPRQRMSRAELAHAVNAALDLLYPGRSLTAQYVDARWVGKLERGEHRWPSAERRAGLRRALGALSDSQLGLFVPRRTDAPKADSTVIPMVDVPAIRGSLQRYVAISTVLAREPLKEPASAVDLRARVDSAWTSFQRGSYTALGARLPDLLRVAQDLHRSTDLDQRHTAAGLLSMVYQVTASSLWKVREGDLAWLAAERGLALAEQTGDPLLISDAARRVAQGLAVNGQPRQALDLLRADVDRLEPGLGTAGPAYLSLYGMLFLLGGVIAARAEDSTLASDWHREGARIASRLGADRNERWTAFGPTNVVLHRVAALVDLQDGDAAVDAAADATPHGLAMLPRERHAAFLVDIARAHALRRDRHTATTVLLEAESIAADEVRCRPAAAGLVTDLLAAGPGAAPLPLRELAARCHAGATA